MATRVPRSQRVGTTRFDNTTSTASYTLTADSRLSQDYVVTASVPLTPGYNPAAVVLMADGVTLSAMGIVQQALTHVVPDDSSSSGWTLVPVSNGSGAQEVVTAIDTSSVTHAFFHDGSSTYHTALGSDDTWGSVDTFGLCTGLGTTVTPGGNVVAYGITSDGNLQFMQLNPSGSAWTSYQCPANAAFAGAQVVLQMTSETAFTLASNVSGALTLYSGSMNAAQTAYSIGQGEPVSSVSNVARIHMAYPALNSTLWLFSDDKNVLYTSVNFSDTPAAIAGSNVAQGAGLTTLVDEVARLSFYGVGSDGTLSALHQTDTDGSGAPVWAPIMPLDTNVQQIVSPPPGANTLAAATLFAMAADTYNSLHGLTQNDPGSDSASSAWTRVAIQQSSAQTYATTMFRTQIDVTNINGAPVNGVTLTVTADRPTPILVDGVTQFVGPGLSATVTSDVTGSVTMTCPANSLVSPTYTITGDQVADLTHAPNEYLQTYLGGSGTVFTGSASIPAMSGATLQTATVGGAPLAPLVSNVNDPAQQKLADAAAQGITSSIAAGLKSTSDAGFALDLRDKKNPVFLRFATAADVDAHRQAVAAQVNLNFLDAIGDLAGDIWNGITTGVLDVVHFAVKTAEDAENEITMLIQVVGSEVQQLVKLAFEGIEDAIALAHAILNAIGATLLKVVQWLMDLLGWADIWNTKLVIESLIVNAPAALQNLISQKAVVETGTFFSGLKSTVDNAFDSAIKQYTGTTLSGLKSGATSNAVALRRGARPASFSLPSFSVSQNNWLLSKLLDAVEDEINPFSGLTTSLPSDLLSTFDNLIDFTDLKNALAAMEDLFKSVAKDPASLTSVGVVDLLTAAKDVVDWVIDELDAIVTDVLKVAAAICGDLQNILTQPLGDIPLVTWLYENVISAASSTGSETPTIANIMALLAAIPATLVYKLANSMNAPFTSAQAAAAYAWTYAAPRPGVVAGFTGFPVNQHELKVALTWTFVPLAGADMAYDLAASGDEDGTVSGITQFFAWWDVVLNGTIQVLTWPIGVFADDWSSMTFAQILSATSWVAGWVPVGGDVLLLLPPLRTCTRANDIGNIVLSAIGAITLGFGFDGALLGMVDDPPTANGVNVAASVFGSLVNGTQFLRLSETVTSSEGVTLLAKAVIDSVADATQAGLVQFAM